MEKQFCPICGIEVPPNSRYSHYVCQSCATKACDEDSRPLKFFNTDLSGGFVAKNAETSETKVVDPHICYIEDVRCWADEARMGGIVIQPCPDQKERIAGALVGLLIGDALGVPYEFHAASELPSFAEIEFEPPAWFRRSHQGVPTGTWSDDGAQALVLLDSLLTRGKFDAAHFAKGLIAWQDNGFMAVDNYVFDVGIQTSKAIWHLKQGVSPLEAGGTDEYSNGNGSLMRVLPLALWHQGTNAELVRDAELQSRVTHAHPRAQICCALYCLWARRSLQNADNSWDSDSIWEYAVETLRSIYLDDSIKTAELEFQIRPDDLHAPGGSGYVVDSLFSAKWACGNDNYEKAVKAAISLGNDTDTTACIAGGVAGLKSGINQIPERWRAQLRGREIYEPLLEKLLKHSAEIQFKQG
ncbi:MAG: ADP-ribosylglycohydrolase family protein [Pyrinomonadaceae bacterium]